MKIDSNAVATAKKALETLCNTPKPLTKTATIIALKEEIKAARKRGISVKEIKKALESDGIFVSSALISQYTTTKAKKHNKLQEI